MDLSPLFKDGILIPLESKPCSPSSVAIDSRKVERGGLFVAIPGYEQDGAIFIADALKKGAVGIVVSQGVGKKVQAYFKDDYPEVAFFEAPEIRKASSILAAYFYPLQPDTVVAVTGTNGKTSVVSFMRQLWHFIDIPAASLGTLGLVREDKPLPPPTGTNGINTPDPITFHQTLQALKEEKISALAFEATSAALHQHRLDNVRLKASVFTNFSTDHLDYHHTLEAYFDAKMRLFNEVMSPETFAVLNTDIPEFELLLSICKKRKLHPKTFGKKGDFVRLISVIPQIDSQDVLLTIGGKSYDLSLPFVGLFQVYNVMAALSAVLACGAPLAQTLDACLNLKGVPGRLEKAAPGIYVDYAHTPDALSLVLKALRSHTKGKLWVVFGCGGNRDYLKRPMMGEIAARLADKVIVTDDNPRYENPDEIRRQIIAKCPEASEIPSRQEAISKAIENREEGDIILIAGKGHETYQLVEDTVIPFNDLAVVRKELLR
jgi:UDP-N-acetylmuramoyl-L-alanyl-D-glutamate--2,6-diaminopimelate ligase